MFELNAFSYVRRLAYYKASFLFSLIFHCCAALFHDCKKLFSPKVDVCGLLTRQFVAVIQFSCIYSFQHFAMC